jgi:TldD protein
VRDLLADLIDSAQARAGYADARFGRSRSERLSTRNGRLDQLDSHESEGIGVRVRMRGAWGFAAVRGTDRADAEAALARAIAIAEAQPASGATPSRCRSRRSSPCCSRRTPACARSRA